METRFKKLPIFETMGLGLQSYFKYIKQFVLFIVVSIILMVIPMSLIVLWLVSAKFMNENVTAGLTGSQIFAFFWGVVLFYVLAFGCFFSYAQGALKAVDSEPLTLKDFFKGWSLVPRYLLIVFSTSAFIFAIEAVFSLMLFGTLEPLFNFELWLSLWVEFTQNSSAVTSIALLLFYCIWNVFLMWFNLGFLNLPFVMIDGQKDIIASIKKSFSLVKGTRLRLFLLFILQICLCFGPGMLSFFISLFIYNTKNFGWLSLVMASFSFIWAIIMLPSLCVINAQAYRFLSPLKGETDPHLEDLSQNYQESDFVGTVDFVKVP